MDLDIIKKFTTGDLSTKQFLAHHRDASELLEILFEHLGHNEQVMSVQDWPEPRRRTPSREFFVLKTMMLLTPIVLVGGLAFVEGNPGSVLGAALLWLSAFGAVAVIQFIRRWRGRDSRVVRTVLVVTNRRLIRVWLDGSQDVQAWWLGDDSHERRPIEAVSSTIKFLLDLDLGDVSMN